MQAPAQPVLLIEVTWDGGTATITLTGDLDITSAPGLTERLMKVAEVHPGRLVLDLGALKFMDVAGGRALDRGYKALEAGCPIIVCWPGLLRSRSSGSPASWAVSARFRAGPSAG